jgi:hypothetical protein
MTIEEVRRLYNARPFRTFTMHLADGRHVSVEHPEFLAFSPRGRTAVVYQPDGSFDIIDLLLVTDLAVRRRPKTRRARSR